MADGFNFDGLIKQIPVSDIAAQLGVDSGDAATAVQKALLGLLGGLAVNAQTGSGASALQGALSEHRTDGSLPALTAVDVEDSKKIVIHASGTETVALVDAVSKDGGDGLSSLVSSVLPMLAPLVMSVLANGLGNQDSSQQSSAGIGGFLGSLLGGDSGGSGRSEGMGDITGQLTAKGENSSPGGLGGSLGSIMGRK